MRQRGRALSALIVEDKEADSQIEASRSGEGDGVGGERAAAQDGGDTPIGNGEPGQMLAGIELNERVGDIHGEIGRVGKRVAREYICAALNRQAVCAGSADDNTETR